MQIEKVGTKLKPQVQTSKFKHRPGIPGPKVATSAIFEHRSYSVRSDPVTYRMAKDTFEGL